MLDGPSDNCPFRPQLTLAFLCCITARRDRWPESVKRDSYLRYINPNPALSYGLKKGFIGRNQFGLFVIPRELFEDTPASVQPHFPPAVRVVNELKNLVTKISRVGVARVQ